jgi:phosphate transport system permease protein
MDHNSQLAEGHSRWTAPPASALGKLFSRKLADRVAGRAFYLATLLPCAGLIAIVVALVIRTGPILAAHPILSLLLGEKWQPSAGRFGFAPFIAGTLWVTGVAMLLAVVPCLLTAIYLTEYAAPAVRQVMKPLLDLLAGIPSVVYGVWGVVAIVPLVKDVAQPMLGQTLGQTLPVFELNNPTGYSVLAAGVVLAVMVAPVIIAVAYEVLEAVPAGFREASLALGATRWQTIKHVVFPKVATGIVAGVALGFSRAFGETLAVLMVVGNVARTPASVFDPAYPLTALIANNYGEMMSIPLYDAALMSAALILLIVVMLFNTASALFLHRVIGGAR